MKKPELRVKYVQSLQQRQQNDAKININNKDARTMAVDVTLVSLRLSLNIFLAGVNLFKVQNGSM